MLYRNRQGVGLHSGIYLDLNILSVSTPEQILKKGIYIYDGNLLKL